MPEFTGERVIPDAVEPDLLNEHVARYAFASRLSRNKRVLDLGCGAGYGTAELAHSAHFAVGLDISREAIRYAQNNYSHPNLHYIQAGGTTLPFRDGSFDLVVAFEVIEHLDDWPQLLVEARRSIAPGGQFIVSTPNKLYYAESRQKSGPNPFHNHEFEFEEFRAELMKIFPHVSLFLENHSDGIVFRPADAFWPGVAEVRVQNKQVAPSESHFFIAVCAAVPQTGAPTFVFLPTAANVLREREQHISILEDELATKDAWLAEAKREHQHLLEIFREQTAQLEKSNLWAQELDQKLRSAGERIVALQQELRQQQAAANDMAAGYEAQVRALEEAHRVQMEHAQQTEARLESDLERLCADLEERCAELRKCVDLLHAAETTVVERTEWALELQRTNQAYETQLSMAQASRWLRLGRAIGLGPALANLPEARKS